MQQLKDTLTNTFYIPDSIFSAEVDAIYLPFCFGDGRHHEGYRIKWPDDNIDGYYELVINIKQMYLRSGHDNPNPDNLYWIVSLTPFQYKLITQQIEQGKKKFKDTRQNMLLYKTFYYEKYDPAIGVYGNLERLTGIFNSALPSTQLILLPGREEFEALPAVRIEGR
jgi:hypothetical protein